MRIPTRIPGLRILAVLFAVYAIIWISLEGNLLRVMAMAVGVTLLAAAFGLQSILGGHYLSPARWLVVGAGWGGLMGLSCGLLAMLFMAVKTGLHTHGPEFTPAEIDWVVSRLPIWTASGLLAGLGLGLLAMAVARGRE